MSVPERLTIEHHVRDWTTEPMDPGTLRRLLKRGLPLDTVRLDMTLDPVALARYGWALRDGFLVGPPSVTPPRSGDHA